MENSRSISIGIHSAAIFAVVIGFVLNGCMNGDNLAPTSTPGNLTSTSTPSNLTPTTPSTPSNTTSQTLQETGTPCPQSGSVNVRFHYSANGSSGSWSGTTSTNCATGAVTIGPQAMEGDMKVNPGTTLKAGYDFTLPGNKLALTELVINPMVVFTLQCVSGAAASPSTLTLAMPTPQSYAVNASNWIPSGDQQSPLVYQDSAVIPNACSGGTVRLDKGGTFSTTITTNNLNCPVFDSTAGGIAYYSPVYDTVGKSENSTPMLYPDVTLTPGSCYNFVSSSDPALPAGLSVNPNTCAISGVPTTPTTGLFYYKVKGQSDCGPVGAVIQISVAPAH